MLKRVLLIIALGSAMAPPLFPQRSLPIPTPLSNVTRSGLFRITSQTRIILGEGTTPEDRFLAELFNRRLTALSRLPLAVTEEQDVRLLTKGSLYIATPLSDFTAEALSKRAPDIQLPAGDESYLLDIRDEGILLVAHTERGRFYAMMSLLGLLSAKGRSLELPHATILDRPHRSRRGFRLVVVEGPDLLQEHLLRLAPQLAAMKLNTIAISPQGDSDLQKAWEQACVHLSSVTKSLGLSVILEGATRPETGSRASVIQLGLLPPGPSFMASVSMAMNCDPRAEVLPSIVLESPSLYSLQWLMYVAAWIAENTWNVSSPDAASFTERFFEISGDGMSLSPCCRAAFTFLQQLPLRLSWEQLWIRPLWEPPCVHSTRRRYRLEALLAGCRCDHTASGPTLTRAVRARMGFLEVAARTAHAQDVLVREGIPRWVCRRAVHTVLEALDTLERALLDAAFPPPFGAQSAGPLAGISFQRRCWSAILASLEPHEGLFPSLPLHWITFSDLPGGSASTSLSYTRTFELPDPPTRAHLLVVGTDAGRLAINDRPVKNRYDSLTGMVEHHPGPVLFDVQEALHPGENTLTINVSREVAERGFSALLDVEFRNGGSLTVTPDTLWLARGEGTPWLLAPSDTTSAWLKVRLLPSPACPDSSFESGK